MSGVSFLPHSDHVYKQAPYQEISKDGYEKWVLEFPKDIDWRMLCEYEKEDTTTATHELACSAGGCEIV
jgi:ribonucleoside-diphosphate reductase alpha chain